MNINRVSERKMNLNRIREKGKEDLFFLTKIYAKKG
jgi:hypothetical protein